MLLAQLREYLLGWLSFRKTYADALFTAIQFLGPRIVRILLYSRQPVVR